MIRVLAAAIAAAALMLAACSQPTEVKSGDSIPEIQVTIRDGRTVTCLKALGSNGGVGISCDWESAS